MINASRLRMIRASLLLIAALGAILIGCLCCQTQAMGKVPKTSVDAVKGSFDYRHIELENGLDVVTLEDFSAPIVAVQVWYHVGSKNERPDRQGFAHLFEHMMFRGTDMLGPTDHFSLLRRVGGSSNGYTSFDRTVYLETLPADQIEMALWLEAERMTFLKIDQKSFDTERKVVEEERRMRLNQPYGTIYENVLSELFKIHPYRWPPIGKIPHLRASKVQELRDFWTKYYTPSNATLIIVGAIKHEQAQKLAKKYFGWIPKYDQPEGVTIVEPPVKVGRSVTIKEDNAPAPGVGVVYRTTALKDADTVPMDLLAEILGGGNSSRLYRELVAEKQLAVMAETMHWSLEQDGIFGAGAVMPPFGSDPNAVMAIIEDNIERLRKEPVTEQELTKAKNQMLRSVITGNLNIESKARTLGSAIVERGDLSYVNRQEEDIRRVTAEDILRVANKYLTDDKVLRLTVERNLLGTMVGKEKKEDDIPVTAEPETEAPKPGRRGAVRSKDYPKKPPLAKIAAAKITPKYSSKVLDNGLKVLVVENHEVPFVTVQLGMLAGAWTEDKPGTAAMTMRMLKKGTKNYSEAELAQELGTYAISLSCSGEMDTSSVTAGFLTDHADRAMKLMGEVTLSPTFPQEEFVKVRKQVLTSLAVSSGEPEYVVDKYFRQELFGDHPYSRSATGEVEDVNSISVEDMKQWWRKFARPDMAVLIFAGDIKKKDAYKLAKKTFGNWQGRGPKPEIQLPDIAQPGQTHIYLVDRPGSIQSQIRVGQLGITRHDPGYFVSRLVSSYFGWGFDGRLNKSIRVDKGLTYSVWGSYIAQRFAGSFKVGTFSNTDTTAQAVAAVVEEIGKLKTEGPTEDELERNQTYILGSFVRERETPQQVAGDLWLIESQQLKSDYLERLLKTIANATPTDCEQLIKRTIDPQKLVITVVGEAEKLKEPLEKIAPVTVIKAE